MYVELDEFGYGLVLHVDKQILRLVGGMPYLYLLADELSRALIEHAADGDS
jgi:hypothetical protein